MNNQEAKIQKLIPIVQGLLASGHYTDSVDGPHSEQIILRVTDGKGSGYASPLMPAIVLDALSILESLESQVSFEDKWIQKQEEAG